MANRVTLQVHEIIKKVSNQRSKADKIKILKENESFALKTLLQGTYNPNIVLDLPEGAPPYTPSAPQSFPSNFFKQSKKLSYFVPPKSTQMSTLKKERLFIQILESIHPEDAELVLQMKDKTPFKGITSAVVKEAFPSILP